MDADSQDAIKKKKIKQYWKIAFPYTFSSNEMREMQVMRTTSQETFAAYTRTRSLLSSELLKEGALLYWYNASIDVGQFCGLTTRNVINHSYVLDNEDWPAGCWGFTNKIRVELL